MTDILMMIGVRKPSAAWASRRSNAYRCICGRPTATARTICRRCSVAFRTPSTLTRVASSRIPVAASCPTSPAARVRASRRPPAFSRSDQRQDTRCCSTMIATPTQVFNSYCLRIGFFPYFCGSRGDFFSFDVPATLFMRFELDILDAIRFLFQQ